MIILHFTVAILTALCLGIVHTNVLIDKVLDEKELTIEDKKIFYRLLLTSIFPILNIGTFIGCIRALFGISIYSWIPTYEYRLIKHRFRRYNNSPEI